MFHILPKPLKRWLVQRRKRIIDIERKRHYAYRETAFIIQTFNKRQNLRALLTPLIKKRVQHIILFADGCIDGSAAVAHKLLKGKHHVVIQANDTHEIHNYRMGLHIAQGWGCNYAVLLQDDDLYEDDLLPWVEKASKEFDKDATLAIVGGNGAANFVPDGCRLADHALTTALFEVWSSGDSRGYKLGDYQRMLYPESHLSSDRSGAVYADTVNRAPQMLSITAATSLDFFPEGLEPYQYDDDYNCLTAWMNDFKVLHMPCTKRRADVGTGGMRLYNNVTISCRPTHFVRNWNLIMHKFGDFIGSRQLAFLVAQANIQRFRQYHSRKH